MKMKLAYGMLPLAMVGCTTQAQEKEQPNVLMIMVDDLNDWIGGMSGYPEAITPNMDKLIEKGTFFSNAHCAQPVSNASRNAMLSGLHPSSTGWYLDTKVMNETYDEVMGENVMLPQYFKDNGYNTYGVGKIFHDGVSDYKDKTDDFWTEYGPAFWKGMEPHIREAGYGYRGYMFYPFPKDGGQLVQAYAQAYGMDTITNYYQKYNRFYSLCGGPLDEGDIPDDGMYDEQAAQWAIDKLENINEDKPFFLTVGFIRPHVPYTAPRRFFDMYDINDLFVPEVPEDEFSDIPLFGKAVAYGYSPNGCWGDVQLKEGADLELVHAYLASTTFMDEQLGKVMDALEKSGKADNTIIVLCSDHGQHLGEKRHYRKQALWEESTRIPMVIYAPNKKKSQGVTYEHPVSLLDIYPTLIDLCGLPKNKDLMGANLVPAMDKPKKVKTEPVLISWKYGNFAVRSKDWRYIQYRDGSEELYNHVDDPGEHINLALDKKYASVIADHKKYIPANPAFPATKTEFTGDAYEARLKEWAKNDSIPVWLR